MFGEYAQVASYMNQDYEHENLTDTGFPCLPSYLLPMFSTTNPWSTGPDNSGLGTEDDFIIIAEFSEIEGPKPLMTIPRDGGHGFDQNAFSVKIMAVDHQISTCGFSISEDTQVLLTDSGEFYVSSFVHHFVLYDNQARGFVRPFCMAYVTRDERKLIQFYEEISLQFRKVSRLFKYGNKMVFVKDLERHAQDLEYTKGCLIVKFNSSSSDERCTDETKYKELHNIQTALEEIKDILAVIKPHLGDKRLENRFYTLETRAWQQSDKPKKSMFDSISLQEHWFSEQGDNPTSHYGSFHDNIDSSLHLFNKQKVYKPKLVEPKRKKKFDGGLRGLHELCSWGAKEGMKKLRCIYEHFKREVMILQLEKEEGLLLDPPSSVLSNGQCVTHNFLSGVSLRLANCSYLGTKPIEFSQKWCSLDTLEGSVESFKSVVSEESLLSAHSSTSSFTMANERFYDEDSGFVSSETRPVQRADSNISSSSDAGPSVYESFPNSPIKTADKTITSQDEATSAGETITSAGETITSAGETIIEDKTITSHGESMLTPGMTETLKTLHETTISHDQSITPQTLIAQDEIVVIQEETVLQQSEIVAPQGETMIAKSAISTPQSEINSPQNETIKSESEISTSTSEIIIRQSESTTSKFPIERDSSACQDTTVSESTVNIVGPCIINVGSNTGRLEINDATSDYIPVNKQYFTSLSRQYSEVDDNTDTTPSSSEGAKLSLYSFNRKPRGGIYTIGDLVFNLRQCSPGIGIIEVLNKYNNLHHIINSLLTGRIVLVIGNSRQETEVIRLVTALSVFLPNHRRKHNSVLEWSSKPLRLTDLSRIKLAGLCRSDKRSVESVVKKYCSIIDVEKKMIIAPTYQGIYINTITSKKKNFKTDADLIAFTQCWLMELASKAFMFYHSFCLGSTNIISHNSSLSAHKQQYCSSVKRFFAKLNIHEGDSPIIEYLTEVMKLLQLDQNIQPSDDGNKVSPVLLSYQSCHIFRC